MSLNSREKTRLKGRRQRLIFNSPEVHKLYEPCENMVLLRHFSPWRINQGNISLIKGKAEVLDWKFPKTNGFQHLEEVHYKQNIPWYFNYIIQVVLSFHFLRISETKISIQFSQYKRSSKNYWVFFYLCIISKLF